MGRVRKQNKRKQKLRLFCIAAPLYTCHPLTSLRPWFIQILWKAKIINIWVQVINHSEKIRMCEVFKIKWQTFQENLGLGSVIRSLCRGLVSGKLSDITFTFSVSRPRAHTLRDSRLSVNSSPVTLFFFWWKICVQCWAGLSCVRQASTDFSARGELLLETPFFSMRLGPDEYETGYKSQENEYKYESGGALARNLVLRHEVGIVRMKVKLNMWNPHPSTLWMDVGIIWGWIQVWK